MSDLEELSQVDESLQPVAIDVTVVGSSVIAAGKVGCQLFTPVGSETRFGEEPHDGPP